MFTNMAALGRALWSNRQGCGSTGAGSITEKLTRSNLCMEILIFSKDRKSEVRQVHGFFTLVSY